MAAPSANLWNLEFALRLREIYILLGTAIYHVDSISSSQVDVYLIIMSL